MRLPRKIKIWTPEAGKTIQHPNGRDYTVADNGSTILAVLGETEDVKREIGRELARCGWHTDKIVIARNGDDIQVRIGKAIGYKEAYDLKGALQNLPSNCGTRRVIAECAKI